MVNWGGFPGAGPTMMSNVNQPVMHQTFRDPFAPNPVGSFGGTYGPPLVGSFGDPYGTPPVGYVSQGNLPGAYGASMAPPMIPHRDSGATIPHRDSNGSTMSPSHRDSNTTALSEMNLFSRNNSVTAGTAVAMPNPTRQAIEQHKVQDLIGAGDVEGEFNPAEFVNEAMLRLGEFVD